MSTYIYPSTYKSPCGATKESSTEVKDSYNSVTTYGCGCKEFENEYGGRVERCDGKPPCLLCHAPVDKPASYCEKCRNRFDKKKPND